MFINKKNDKQLAKETLFALTFLITGIVSHTLCSNINKFKIHFIIFISPLKGTSKKKPNYKSRVNFSHSQQNELHCMC